MKIERNILTDLFHEFAEFPLIECGDVGSPVKRYSEITIHYWHDPWPISPWIDSKVILYQGKATSPIEVITYSEEATYGAESLNITQQKELSTYLLPLMNDLTNFLRGRMEIHTTEYVRVINLELFKQN